MSELYEKDKPSGCILSDSCNFIIGCSEDENPFGNMTDEDFAIVMVEISECIKAISDHMDTLQANCTLEEMYDLLTAMKRVNQLAVIEVNENRNYNQ